MEDKIKQACKIIVKLGDNYSLKEWHEACIQILDLGITVESLKQFISTSNGRDTLGDMEKGNYYVAANYIINFISWNESMPWVIGYSDLVKSFVRVVDKN